MDCPEIRNLISHRDPAFIDMLGDYLEEESSNGSELSPSVRNFNFLAEIARLYLFGQIDGVVLLAGEVGFLLWGKAPNQLDYRWGKTAVGWGTYVRPGFRGQGISKALREEGKRQLRNKGFAVVLGAVLVGNTAGKESGIKAGFEIYREQGVLRL